MVGDGCLFSLAPGGGDLSEWRGERERVRERERTRDPERGLRGLSEIEWFPSLSRLASGGL